MQRNFDFLALPRELRDMIYAYVYAPTDEVYLSFQTVWSQDTRTVVQHQTLSDSLRTALSLNAFCRQLRKETNPFLKKSLDDRIIHIWLLNHDDAKCFPQLAQQLQNEFPNLNTLAVTVNISGEHTYLLNNVPAGIWPRKRFQLEIVDGLNTRSLLHDADILSARRDGVCYIFREKSVGRLSLKTKQLVLKNLMKTGKVVDRAWLLIFE
jgi:hypothetical protein